MDTSTVILQIAIILIVARVFGEIAAYFLVPAVIGGLVAGVILGPTLFGFIEAHGMIRILAELGRSSGLFNNDIYVAVIMVIAYTTISTSFWLRLFYKRFGSYVDD